MNEPRRIDAKRYAVAWRQASRHAMRQALGNRGETKDSRAGFWFNHHHKKPCMKLRRTCLCQPGGYAKGMTGAIRRMEVGDSFVIEKSKRQSAYMAAKRLGDRKISVWEVDGAYRVWRIA